MVVKLYRGDLPADFDAQKAQLPKPVRTEPERQGRRPDAGRGGQPEAKRQFHPRKPGGVGVHKAAVRRTSAR